MKYILALLLSASTALAGSVTIAFDYSQQPIALAYAKIYVGTSVPVLLLLPPGSTSITNRMTNLVDGATNSIAASVVSAGQVESDKCPAISVVVPMPPSPRVLPVGLSSIWLPSTGGVVQVSRDLETWRERLTLRQSTNAGYALSISVVPDQPNLFLRPQPPPQIAPIPIRQLKIK